MSLQLKKAKKKDFRKLARIYVEGYSEPPFNEPWTLKKALLKLKLFSKYCDIWSIYADKKLVGFIIMNPNQWCPGETVFGEEMAIEKPYRRKGIATDILKKILNIYKNRGYKRFIGIVNKNAKSFGLHKKIKAGKSKKDFIIEKKLK